MEYPEYIVVGSGISGAHAAQTLIESGAKVLMLDVGNRDSRYSKLIPDRDFLSIRKNDENQHRFFLGDDFEGIPWGGVRVGAQLTPPRTFISRDTEKWLRIVSEEFQPLESLAYGGLGAGWGAGCFAFSKPELEAVGLKRDGIREAYNEVSRRIGVSGAYDDGADYCTADLDELQEPIEIDPQIKDILKSYSRKRKVLNSRGFFLGRSSIALLTRDLGDRTATSYNDMEFWCDSGDSTYRAWMTVDNLLKNRNFRYVDRMLVTRFNNLDHGVEVHAIDVDSAERVCFSGGKLILASGVLGTARIVVRSFEYRKTRLPIICNPYCYIPCVRFGMMRSTMPERKTSLAQLYLFYDGNHDNFGVGAASIFTYRSLLMFKLAKEAPLNQSDALELMRFLLPSIAIVGIFHPENGGSGKYIELVKDGDSPTGDVLRASYSLSKEEQRALKRMDRAYLSALIKLGCLPLKVIYPHHGSSIHYGGALPFSEKNEPLTLSPDGRLHGTKRVYVADGSGFKYLPGKGVSLTLMANAHLVARRAMEIG